MIFKCQVCSKREALEDFTHPCWSFQIPLSAILTPQGGAAGDAPLHLAHLLTIKTQSSALPKPHRQPRIQHWHSLHKPRLVPPCSDAAVPPHATSTRLNSISDWGLHGRGNAQCWKRFNSGGGSMLRRLKESFFSKPHYGRDVSVPVQSPHSGPPVRASHPVITPRPPAQGPHVPS